MQKFLSKINGFLVENHNPFIRATKLIFILMAYVKTKLLILSTEKNEQQYYKKFF